jgi:endonuclease/exonuclease/phosphatase family metal-dependent hydrolase
VLQSIEKTSEYRKRCFDTIVPTIEENKALKGDIVRLQEALQQVQNERDTLQTSVDEQHHLLDQEKRGI